MSKGRSVLVKFDAVEPNPGKGLIGRNRVKPVGIGVVIEKGGQYDMSDRLYALGGYQAGLQVIVNTKLKVGDKVQAESYMGGC